MAGSSVRNSPPRCIQCNPQQKENARNLVVCIDASRNLPGLNNTNVVKLFAMIDLETTVPEQRAYYSSGFSTQPKASHIIRHLGGAISKPLDVAVAWSLKNNVKEAYSWLSGNYQEGDQIYLFGFSRGAYQVRMLAEMIHEVGLIRVSTGMEVGRAYDCYEAIRSGRPKTRQIAREFKNEFSWKDLEAHFIGVWDTVSSARLVGIDRFISTSSSATHACHFRHALALDERRLGFIPQYFHEINSPSTDGRSEYAVKYSNDGHGKEKKSRIKEVWFAGSHSDVGGRNRFGKSHQAGNVSLLWMRREVAASGLKLKPTDMVWVPDDLDFGTTNSMISPWRYMEYMPVKRQVSLNGPGDATLRPHKFQPRRIIPGQKVHASVLYANSYKPTATLGEGFDIPIVQPGHDDAGLDNGLWETGFFDDTAAQEIVNRLNDQQGVAPIFLDRLLFMLRFEEGKESVRNVPGWQNKFMKLIEGDYCTLPVRLLTIVAFHEASCDLKAHPDICEPFPERFSHDIFVEAESCLKAILATRKHRDGPRVLALLRPLTKHRILRQRILTHQVLENLMILFDAIIKQPTGNFGKAMDGLNCLLQCEDSQRFLIGKLGETPEGFNASRLAEILEVKDSGLLTSALRMMLILARIPDARPVCFPVLHRIRKLASTSDRLVGQLAVKIYLALYDETGQYSLDIRDTHVRANLASVLVHGRGSADDQGRPVDPGQLILSRFFGVDAVELTNVQKRLIGELKTAVEKGDAWERTAATLTLLKLCETEVMRGHLRSINLLELFVKQLQRKDSALLAAYALTTCLKYPDMQGPIQDNDDLPTCLVAMLAFDYFDDAVGQMEGFQIFRDFMQYACLRKKIENYKVAEILDMKLSRGRPKDIRTSLICLKIFQSFDLNGLWLDELVESSLERLTNEVWKVQKAGVTILSVLVQTEHGVGTISPRIHEIVEMLLPRGYLAVSGTAAGPTSMNADSGDDGQVQINVSSLIAPDEPPSSMLGPACALRVLVENETLRVRVRETLQYASLKHFFLSGTLVGDVDLSPRRTWTPNRIAVIQKLDELIKVVDGKLPEGLMSIWDPFLPPTANWGSLALMIPFLPVSAALVILGVVVLTPVVASVQVFDTFKSLYLDCRASVAAQREHTGEADPGSHQVEGAVTPQNVEMQGS